MSEIVCDLPIGSTSAPPNLVKTRKRRDVDKLDNAELSASSSQKKYEIIEQPAKSQSQIYQQVFQFLLLPPTNFGMPTLKPTHRLLMKKTNQQHQIAAESEEKEEYSEDGSEEEVPFDETTSGRGQEQESRIIDDESGNEDDGVLLNEMLTVTDVELARPTLPETYSAEETLVFHITEEELTDIIFYATK
ncbi:hypothetical protein GHT06_008989 [Daphnia sinensis]|uniref:Uncharacterized protein n=1 Tax=Daphnia sinensis TaxID=1820382 RepID=A0AAD5LMX2_9CRUS|nr:hypothetical protein GHT06_008989 [Daphnia sinensis]